MEYLLNTTNKVDINHLLETARKAGAKILEIYHRDTFEGIIDFKSDDSPLTLADKESNKIIVAELSKLYPQIPFISEEEKETEYDERKSWEYFWLIDPLDGTKEFIKRNGEFTVNIALIKDKYPVAGIVYAPVTDTMYIGVEGLGAFLEVQGKRTKIEVNKKQKDLIAVGSRSHAAPVDELVLSKYSIASLTSIGSSLKFCLVAEGKADIYYRSGPTMEWDTAAGQAVLESAGGKMNDANGNRFQYNKENLLNGGFLCTGF